MARRFDIDRQDEGEGRIPRKRKIETGRGEGELAGLEEFTTRA